MCRRIVLYYATTSTAGEFTGVTKDLGGATVRRGGELSPGRRSRTRRAVLASRRPGTRRVDCDRVCKSEWWSLNLSNKVGCAAYHSLSLAGSVEQRCAVHQITALYQCSQCQTNNSFELSMACTPLPLYCLMLSYSVRFQLYIKNHVYVCS